MEELGKLVVSVVEKLRALEKLTVQHNEVLHEFRKLMSQEIAQGAFDALARDIVLEAREPVYSIIDGWRCEKEVKVQFTGTRLDIGAYIMWLNKITADLVVKLVGLELCNPGILDRIVSAVREMNEKMAKNLETLKQVVTVAKMMLSDAG